MCELIDTIVYIKSYYFWIGLLDIEFLRMKYFIGKNLSFNLKVNRVEIYCQKDNVPEQCKLFFLDIKGIWPIAIIKSVSKMVHKSHCFSA